MCQVFYIPFTYLSPLETMNTVCLFEGGVGSWRYSGHGDLLCSVQKLCVTVTVQEVLFHILL